MKRLIALFTAIMLMTALCIGASATTFVPSITYDPNIPLVPNVPVGPGFGSEDDGGDQYAAIFRVPGMADEYLHRALLIVTHISYVLDGNIDVSPEITELLLYVYNRLITDDMTIPFEMLEDYEKVIAEGNTFAIRDLIDIRWASEPHDVRHKVEGVTVELTFDLGIQSGIPVYVMCYDKDTDTWEPIVSAVNNDDGTVTCIFEYFGVMAFCVPAPAESSAPVTNTQTEAPVQQEQSNNSAIWLTILAVAAVAAVTLVIKKKPASNG